MTCGFKMIILSRNMLEENRAVLAYHFSQLTLCYIADPQGEYFLILYKPQKWHPSIELEQTSCMSVKLEQAGLCVIPATCAGININNNIFWWASLSAHCLTKVLSPGQGRTSLWQFSHSCNCCNFYPKHLLLSTPQPMASCVLTPCSWVAGPAHGQVQLSSFGACPLSECPRPWSWGYAEGCGHLTVMGTRRQYCDHLIQVSSVCLHDLGTLRKPKGLSTYKA